MRIVFEVMKLCYVVLMLGTGVLYFNPDEILSSNQISQYMSLILPAYLVLTGIMIGYVAYELTGSHERQMSGYLIGGTVLGVCGVVLFMMTGRGGFETVG